MIKKIKMDLNNHNVQDDVPELYMDPLELENYQNAFHRNHLLFEIITAMRQSTQEEILEKFDYVLEQDRNSPSFCIHCNEHNYH